MNNFLSIKALNKEEILEVINKTDAFAKEIDFGDPLNDLQNKIVALLFYEPSTRTFSSFASAVKRLGGQTLEFQNPLQTSSAVKGETLEDTVRVLENYADCIVIRHPEIGTAKKVADAVNIPVINAGDGSGEHPTQALQDLYTIYSQTGRLTGIKGLIVGDVLNGRTVHSLLDGLSLFENNIVYILAPETLRFTPEMKAKYEQNRLEIHEINTTDDIPPDCQFWYWTRVQKERFNNLEEYESLKLSFILTKELLSKKGNNEMIIMHPLPRVGEIELVVDDDPRAIYLTKQIKNGLYTRMTLLRMLLE
ncbi:MAG TPA: aspartate carbamoyltransferase [Candidatus Nitrosocosmicus sp.]|nr:aspartate carbamoyltransferase [Candidatus Nitrosocosmicus sp.]